MRRSKNYDEYDAVVRVPKGTRLDRSRSTAGAHRALARDASGSLVGQAEIFDLQKSNRRSGRSSAQAPNKQVVDAGIETAPDISRLVPLALVAVAGIAAGVAGAKVAQNARKRRRADPVQIPSAAPASAVPAGWYEIAGAPTRLRFWDGFAWTEDYAQRAGAAPTIGADWYPDPSNAAQLRYWNGSVWTHHVSPRPGAVTTPADWYPDPSDPAQLRYWDGTAWTHHVSAGPGLAVGVRQGSAAHAARHVVPSHAEPQMYMSGAEWQAHVEAWFRAGAIQQELWRRLSTARIHDADAVTREAQCRMEALTPQERERRLHAILEQNPALRNSGTILDFMQLLASGQQMPLDFSAQRKLV